MFIAYSQKNGVKYARVCRSVWKNGSSRQETVHNLGRVIDQKKGVYRNRAKGLFTYSLEKDEFGTLDDI